MLAESPVETAVVNVAFHAAYCMNEIRLHDVSCDDLFKRIFCEVLCYCG